MPYVKIWIHAVWSTKNRVKLMPQPIRQDIFTHIHNNGLEKGMLIDSVNGYSEHVHCLFRLKNDQTISKVMQLLKGESSFWANKQKLIKSNFEWQDEYYAVSVSESQVNTVRQYIQNQEPHHKRKTFDQECNEFIRKYGFRIIKAKANFF
ncbi:IS200/IS605 family transposase [Candidatus Amoebophilus asiaticus]|nr:IS200/IS605 family transposase [Candidatus Amoebophilus asiaticus]